MSGEIVNPNRTPPECDHGLTFDEKASEGLSADEVRRRWPRLFGACQMCGYTGIAYVSLYHYIAGDW